MFTETRKGSERAGNGETHPRPSGPARATSGAIRYEKGYPTDADISLRPITSTSRVKERQGLSCLRSTQWRELAGFASDLSPLIVTAKPWPPSVHNPYRRGPKP